MLRSATEPEVPAEPPPASTAITRRRSSGHQAHPDTLQAPVRRYFRHNMCSAEIDARIPFNNYCINFVPSMRRTGTWRHRLRGRGTCAVGTKASMDQHVLSSAASASKWSNSEIEHALGATPLRLRCRRAWALCPACVMTAPASTQLRRRASLC